MNEEPLNEEQLNVSPASFGSIGGDLSVADTEDDENARFGDERDDDVSFLDDASWIVDEPDLDDALVAVRQSRAEAEAADRTRAEQAHDILEPQRCLMLTDEMIAQMDAALFGQTG